MDKIALALTLIAVLEEELALTENAARDATDYATHSESKATSQWDTQGLEASYLAHGQANHARDLRDAIARIHALKAELRQSKPHETVHEGSLVTLSSRNEVDRYWIVPCGGGESLSHDGGTVWTLTPQSPLGRLVVGKHQGDAIALPSGDPARITALQ